MKGRGANLYAKNIILVHIYIFIIHHRPGIRGTYQPNVTFQKAKLNLKKMIVYAFLILHDLLIYRFVLNVKSSLGVA